MLFQQFTKVRNYNPPDTSIKMIRIFQYLFHYLRPGGLKVWECTYDLLSFFVTNNFDFKNKNVLDLGCGCGLLGIFAGLRDAAVVHFQDYVSVFRHCKFIID